MFSATRRNEQEYSASITENDPSTDITLSKSKNMNGYEKEVFGLG